MRDLRWGVAVVALLVEALALALVQDTCDGGPLDRACGADGLRLRSWSATQRGWSWLTWMGALPGTWSSEGTLTGYLLLGCSRSLGPLTLSQAASSACSAAASRLGLLLGLDEGGG